MTMKAASPRSRQRGITLIELMIVVVIIAVLGALAFPSYRQYSIRTQRTEAKAALLQLAANQERWYLDQNTYTTNLANLGFPGGVTPEGNYSLAIPVANATTFRARATAVAGGNLADDAECSWFEINSQGTRTAAGANCW